MSGVTYRPGVEIPTLTGQVNNGHNSLPNSFRQQKKSIYVFKMNTHLKYVIFVNDLSLEGR